MGDIVLMDGGMGQELIRRTRGEPTPLWSARVMLEEPDLVRDVHVENIRAGARMIILNTYSVTRCRLGPAGIEDMFLPLQARACALAREAIEEAEVEGVRIAGCLPPLKWSYRHEEVDPAEETAPVYAELAELQAGTADVMLCETMASIEQSLGAVRGAAAAGLPIWVAWTVGDEGTGALRSGESLADASAALGEIPVAARLVNCSIPEAVNAALPHLAALGGRWGAYANGFTGIPDSFAQGTTVKMLEARGDVPPGVYGRMALDWAGAGAAIIGGCCEISPAHIAAVAAALQAEGHGITGDLA